MIDIATLACTPHRNVKRTFIEGQILARNGFTKGARYDREITDKGVVIRLSDNGRFVVSGKSPRGCEHIKPVLDISNSDYAQYTQDAEQVHVAVQHGYIVISVHPSEARKAAREKAFIDACINGELTEGTLCVGIGMSTLALHQGLQQEGFKLRTDWVVDRETAYIDVAVRNNSTITNNTRIINSALEMVENSDYTPVNICQFSLPCTGHSKSGKTSNKIKMAEQHPTDAVGVYGLLKSLDSINAAIYVSENVIEAQGSATYILVKSTLQAIGYNIYESILDSEQSGSIENRPRYWFVAISKGLAIDTSVNIPRYPRAHERLGEIMEPIADDDPMWSENTYLKQKAIRDAAKGNGFTRQLVTADTKSIGVINRHYAKRQSTPPMVVREDGMERLLTPVEHARAKQCSPTLIADTTQTIAHQGLGQGIDMKQGEGIARFIGQAICKLVKAPRKQTTGSRQLSLMTLLFGDAVA
jgi:DNA (cytosine-5)-methyltransferase 1